MAPAKSLLLFCLVCVISIASSGPVSKCNTNDSKCHKQSTLEFLPRFIAGIPEYNVESLETLHFKNIDASSQNLKLLLKDLAVTGSKSCVPKKVERTETKIIVKTLCDIQAEGQYEMHGHLLVLPIEGNGKAHVKLNKLMVTVDSDINTKTGKDGKKHWHVKSSSFKYELKDKAYVRFENLFSGNEVLARAAEDVIENNGNEIILEVGNPVVKAIVDKVVENVQHFFKAVPIDELSLD